MIKVKNNVDIKSPPTWLIDKFTFKLTTATGSKTYKLYKKKGREYTFPYGARYLLDERGIEYEDLTNFPPLTTKLADNIKLLDSQVDVVKNTLKYPTGVLFSEPGTGKTVMGCKILATLSTKTLILVPTLYLLEQWVERIQYFLGVTPAVLGGKSRTVGDITIATFSSAIKVMPILENAFGLVIIDETHRIAATTYKTVVDGINARYKLGLTGTLERKDGLEFMVTSYLADNVVINLNNQTMSPCVVIIKTKISIGSKNYVDTLTDLSTNAKYNNLIASVVEEMRSKNRLQLILTLRTEHLSQLENLISPCALVSGKSKPEDRKHASTNIHNHRVIIATNVLDEGADIPVLDTLHLCAPTNNIPKLIQRVNRITRAHPDKKTPIVFDYWFESSPAAKWSVIPQQQERLRYYRQKGWKVWIR